MNGYVRPESLLAYNVQMMTFYAVFLLVSQYALFGFLRTLATRLPLPKHVQFELMPLDIPPKLYWFSPPSRKYWKLVTYGLLFLVFLVGWGLILVDTHADGSVWFGWGLVHTEEGERTVFTLHGLLFWILAVVLGSRAVRHANKFPQLQQSS